MLAQEVMTPAAALLNDTAMSVFTFNVQIPYLNIALNELQEELELNNVPITNESDAFIVINPHIEGIGGGGGQPTLPPNLVEPITLFERQFGDERSFTDMKKCDFLPVNQTTTAYLVYWSWEGDRIKFIPGGATSQLVVQIHYVKSIFKSIAIPTDIIQYNRAQSFLMYRTAALCSEFIGENKVRADELNGYAGLALIRSLGLSTKNKQSITTRRRPFMGSWRRRRVL